jgi:hypothetical protein
MPSQIPGVRKMNANLPKRPKNNRGISRGQDVQLFEELLK